MTNPFNLRVIEEFRANGGKVGDMFDGIPLLLLTTKGIRSGLPRTTPLVYLADAGRLLVFAANGGAPKAPAWYGNLMAAGEGEVEVGAERYAVRPELVAEEEHERLWTLQTEQDANFANFRGRTDRTIPVVSLVRATTRGGGTAVHRRAWPYSI
ncbi:nitroreductase/quinone reductase family protein [Streptomyces sp. NPDC000410]|uniref:nitroreductase/quinone reductase family protein n=1 Tax=Streptomyces sp. NPDC000410 TaxID=3154254 RepID=UPI003327E1BD